MNDCVPARLRNWSSAIERGADCLDAIDPYILRLMAAAWEADRAELEKAKLDHALLGDDYVQLKGDIDQLRAALERETKRADNAQAIYSDEVRLRENYGRQLVAQSAALERARALAAKWRSQFEVRAGECVTGYPDCWAYADELRDALSAPDGAR